MTVLYPDVLFIINFFVDFMLLTSTGLITGSPIRRLRLTIAATIGAVYGVLTVFFSATSHVLLLFLIGLTMCLTAFGFTSICRIIQHLLTFFLSSLTCGGCTFGMWYLTGGELGAKTIFLASAAVFLLLGYILKGRIDGADISTRTIRTDLGGVMLRVLKDTGNRLRDPYTNGPVMIVWKKQILPLLTPAVGEAMLSSDLSDAEVLYSLLRSSFLPGARLIPYCTVGTSAGMLLSFSAEQMLPGKAGAVPIRIAVSEHPISDGRSFDAVIGL